MRIRHVLVGLAAAALLGGGSENVTLQAKQDAERPAALTPISQRSVAFGVTAAARTLREPTFPDTGKIEAPEDVRQIKNPKLPKQTPLGLGDEGFDLAMQPEAPQTANMPGPLVSFDGNSSQDNANAFGGRLFPPDTNGDVGPNHYVQQTNLLVRVFNKTGAPLTLPFKLSSLFSTAGVCKTNDNGDPVVVYDPLADRWLLSQFGFTSISSPPYHQCIAISTTPDPTGTYFAYDFTTPGSEFPDYPKLGVWPDGYYMTTNEFLSGGPFDGVGAYAFDRKKMLAGDPTASFIYFHLNPSAPATFDAGGMLPSDLDGIEPPPAGAPNVFSYYWATEFGDPSDALKLFNFHADFASPGSSTFIERPESPVATAAFAPLSGRIPEPSPGAALDTLSDRLMFRLQYRKTGATETLVVTHSVDVDPATFSQRAGVRYYELRRTGGTYSIFEQATFSTPDLDRWMGSAAEDNQRNLAVGYSVASSTVMPSIRYAGRLATDPAGGLFQGEATLVTGTGVQTGGARWGDYSALTLDPTDDCTFWYTTEYYTAASQASSSVGWLTRVGSFKFPTCSAPAKGTVKLTLTNCSTNAPIAGASVTLNGVLYGVTNSSGQLTATVAPGTYTLVATSSTGSVSQSVTVTANLQTPVALCITGAAQQPDLVVTVLTVVQKKTGPGQSITINDTTANSGAGAAAASSTQFYLSTNATLDAGDALFGSRAVPALAAGSSNSGSTSATIPAGTTPGLYFVIAKADGPGAISESNEGNNTLTTAKKITIGPDLIIKSFTAPASATRGTTITVNDTTKNNGGSTTVVASTTKFYLSLDKKVGGGDTSLGSRGVPVLAAGAASSGPTSVLIPASTAPGTYFLLAQADGTSAVSEVKETNNVKAIQITINP